MSQLQPHQQRVVEEHAQLHDRYDKLCTFLTTQTAYDLPAEEQALLEEQSRCMYEYLQVLGKRIRKFHGDKFYTCHKKVLARPMTRGAYNALQGWSIPAGENPEDPGYLVQYLDGGKPNHADFPHYISWSPKEVFENGYKERTA